MATIKEKAEKCIPYPCPMWYAGDDEGYEKSKNDVDTKRHIFELGANCVLEEIENVIKSDRILGHPFPSLEMRYNQIISVIEQIKEK